MAEYPMAYILDRAAPVIKTVLHPSCYSACVSFPINLQTLKLSHCQKQTILTMEDRRRDSRSHKMTLRSKKQEPMYWESLSAELRLMILEIHTRQKNPGWASCAAVCKEWQLFIEKKNFHRMRLPASCLDEFKHMVIRQRDIVRHIQFIIELPEYLCYSCKTYKPRESLEESVIGDMI